MIKIFRSMYGSINIEFDETGNCDILKMFNELYKGREYQLRVEFDMGIIQKKKRGERDEVFRQNHKKHMHMRRTGAWAVGMRQ